MFNSQIDEIKNRLDIIDVVGGYIRLQKAGRNHRALCPFHNEKTPSFMVSPERQIWHCFGCNEGGDIFGFVMKMDGLEFGDALQMLAKKAGVILKQQDPKIRTQRQKFYEICELATKFFEKQLQESKIGEEMQKYLKERGVADKTIKEWRLGYAPDTWHGLEEFLVNRGYKYDEMSNAGLIIKKEEIQNSNYYDRFRDRIMFPVCDINGQVVGFSGRINPVSQEKESALPTSRQAKYINSPQTFIYDKSKILFGLDKAKIEIRKQNSCVIVEGNMDAIMSHQTAIKNSVASSGTALTDWQLKIIKRYTDNLTIAFDADVAGDTATKKGIDLALQNDFNVKIIKLTEKDPADLIKISQMEWEKAVQNSQEIIKFYFDSAFSKFNQNVSEAKIKKQISQILLPIVKKIKNKIEQAHWVQELAKKISLDEKILWEQIKIMPADRQAGRPVDNPVYTKTVPAAITTKNQTEFLEARLAGLLLAWPQKFDLTKIETGFLSNQKFIQIIKALKQNQKNPSFAKVSEGKAELADLKNSLLFQIENLPIKEKDVAQEIEFCFNELKRRRIKNKLEEIGQQIREAEQKKDGETVSNLLEKFRKLSKELI